LRAAGKIRVSRPDTRFLVAAFNERHAATTRAMALAAGVPVEVHTGRTPEIIELADACVAVSGSVSLELMYRAKPTVVIYHVTQLLRWLARRFVKLRYITLVNLLAKKELFPEFLSPNDESDRIAGHVLGWLNEPAKRDEIVRQIISLRDRVAVPGACERAADFLLGEVDGMTQRRAA
jgi:lipid-A-disaccharide synthase